MAKQFGDLVRNGIANAIQQQAGSGAVLKIRTLGQPSNCASADVGSVLATLLLPSTWLTSAPASGVGVVAKNGTWQDLTADNTGTAAHFRIYDTAQTTCHMQGSVSGTGGGGDMELSTVSITAGWTITVTGFTLTAPHA